MKFYSGYKQMSVIISDNKKIKFVNHAYTTTDKTEIAILEGLSDVKPWAEHIKDLTGISGAVTADDHNKAKAEIEKLKKELAEARSLKEGSGKKL